VYAKIYVCIPDKSGIHTLHSSLGHRGKFVFPERQQYVSAMGEAIKNGHWQFVCFKKNPLWVLDCLWLVLIGNFLVLIGTILFLKSVN
jgi:hypothetical protein